MTDVTVTVLAPPAELRLHRLTGAFLAGYRNAYTLTSELHQLHRWFAWCAAHQLDTTPLAAGGGATRTRWSWRPTNAASRSTTACARMHDDDVGLWAQWVLTWVEELLDTGELRWGRGQGHIVALGDRIGSEPDPFPGSHLRQVGLDVRPGRAAHAKGGHV